MNVVHGDGSVGAALVTSDIDAIAFVGSHITGEKILKSSGYRRTLIEASGNGPVIVLRDADVSLAAQGAVSGAFTCAGQVCCASERVIVDRKVHDEFVAEVLKEAARWKLGDPLRPDTLVGPLNNELVAGKMDAHLDDATKQGAEVLLGGSRASGYPTNLYYEPTVVDGVRAGTLIGREETFGPIVPIIDAVDDADALEIANDTPLGLQVAVYTKSLKSAFHFAENLRAGNVIVNGPTTWWEPHVPFGGASGTRTGMGRYDGHMALLEMTDLRTIALGVEALACSR
jgi:succinate-semialdehyde dehydrogenase/glutarate-semialdehyde dehydrogenase